MPGYARPVGYVPRQTHECDAAVLVRRQLADEEQEIRLLVAAPYACEARRRDARASLARPSYQVWNSSRMSASGVCSISSTMPAPANCWVNRLAALRGLWAGIRPGRAGRRSP